jgi:hypothetical protein
VYRFPLAFGCFIEVYVSPPLSPSANASEAAPAHDLGNGRVPPATCNSCTGKTATAALQRFVLCASWRCAGGSLKIFNFFGYVLLQDIGIDCISST